jgi:hypothetical protein
MWHVWEWGEERNACCILVGMLKEGGHLEDLDIDEKKILKLLLKEIV